MNNKRQKSENHGRIAEFIAIIILTLKGYIVLKTRYKTHYGEIDIIATRGKTIAFIEVKFRKTIEMAQFSVTQKQMQRISNAAKNFCKNRKFTNNMIWRYDVMAFAPYKIPKHIKDAYRPDYLASNSSF